MKQTLDTLKFILPSLYLFPYYVGREAIFLALEKIGLRHQSHIRDDRSLFPSLGFPPIDNSEMIDQWRELLFDRTSPRRLLAISVLGCINTPEAREILKYTLTHPYADFRMAVVEAIEINQIKELLDELQHSALNDDNVNIRQKASEAIQKITLS